jgi:transposase
MDTTEVVRWIGMKYQGISPTLNEHSRRRWVAVEAQSLGRGGVSAVAEATGLSRTTIYAGWRAWRRGRELPPERVRGPGGGRKALAQTDPGLMATLRSLLEGATRGDPQTPLLWTCKSVRKLAAECNRAGHRVCFKTVATLLARSGYSLQGNRKTREGAGHPDRDAQFRHISQQVGQFQRRRQPVISVDTKKKELVGDFRNAGREWRPKGQPLDVRVHDFLDKELGKAIPYGVYDLTNNEGWVSVGIDHDTAEFAAQAIGRWWSKMEQDRASHVLSHHPELARQTAGQPRGDHPTHRRHDHQRGLAHSSRTEPRDLSCRSESEQGSDG